jgi:uncharacterized protein (TIGR02147 family)
MTGVVFKKTDQGELKRPDIFVYTEYKTFLRDYLHFFKLTDADFSIRKLALEAGVSVGYISTMMKPEHDLTSKAVEKLVPCLRLSRAEASYFRILASVTANSTQEEKLWALKRLNKFKKFAKLNPEESLVTNYFSKWYHIAIREMANQKGFKLDPIWIQARLNFTVPLAEISKAVEFLMQHKLIRVKPDGTFESSEERVKCGGDIYRFILTHFYKQSFELAGESIDTVPRERRNLRSHTVNLAPERFEAAREIMDRALSELVALSDDPSEDSSVYQFLLLGFPFTSPVKDNKK